MRKNLTLIVSLMLVFAGLTGCSLFKPYCADIQQGNVVDQKDTKQLQTGMNKSEVQDVMGSPVLSSGFSNDHWVYAYTNQINGGKVEKKIVNLYFDNGSLVKIESKVG